MLGQLDIHSQKYGLGSFLSHIKINSKWIIDLIVRAETINIPEKKTGSYLSDLEFNQNFLDMIPKVQVIKEQINELNIKIKNFCALFLFFFDSHKELKGTKIKSKLDLDSSHTYSLPELRLRLINTVL